MERITQVRHRSARAVAIAAGTVALTFLAACSSSGGSSTTSSSSPTGGAAETGASTSGGGSDNVTYAKAQVAKYEAGIPVSDVAKIANVPDIKGKTVWYIPIGNSVPVLALFGTSMGQALSHLGAKLHVCDGNFLPTTIAQCMGQAADQGAYAVVTAYIDYSLIPTAYENLVKHHIPVLVGGEAPSDGRKSDKSLAFFDTSAGVSAIGTVEADAAIADSNGKADILYVNLTDSSGTMAATKSAQAEVTARCPGCKFQTVDMQTAKLDKVPSAVSAKLVADPNIDYVMNSDDTFVTAIISGIRSAGKGTKVKVISAAGDLAGLQRIKANNMQIYDMGAGGVFAGWSFADALLRLLAGAAPVVGTTAGNKLFSKNNVGSLDLTPANYNTNAWYGGDAFEKTYLTAWGAQ